MAEFLSTDQFLDNNTQGGTGFAGQDEAVQSPFNFPDFNVGVITSGDSLHSDWLTTGGPGGNAVPTDANPGPGSAFFDQVNGVFVPTTDVTPSNYLFLFQEVVRLRQAQGEGFSDSELLSLMDAYRQLAGLPPLFITVENGVAVLETPADIGGGIVSVSEFFDNIFGGVTSFDGSFGSGGIVSQGLSTVSIVAAAAIVLGIAFLVRRS